jgi:ABC-2 type transport system ATP-binding protein
MNDEGMTILYTTHYMEEAQELSDRIGIMDHGKLIALGTLEELTKLVGQKETLTLKLTREVDDQQLTDVISGMDGVDAVTAVRDELILNVESAKAILSPIVQKLSDQGLTIRTIDIQEPNLEAVFLHLTGRALRD